jgi:hypothetical protein
MCAKVAYSCPVWGRYDRFSNLCADFAVYCGRRIIYWGRYVEVSGNVKVYSSVNVNSKSESWYTLCVYSILSTIYVPVLKG